jgi:hypothetical protein
MPRKGDCGCRKIAVPLHRQIERRTLKIEKGMKTMNRMRMQMCCCQMMVMTMKENVYIIGNNNQKKKKKYEDKKFVYSSHSEHQRQQYLG